MWKARVHRALDNSGIAQRIIKRRRTQEITQWKARDHALPIPHGYKSARVREIGRTYRCSTLVETGTLVGDMIHTALPDFRHIHSIELSPYFVARARLRFDRYPNVTLHEGDSGTVLPKVLATLHERALLWLDAHYSGGPTARGVEDSPIARELAAAKGRGHCILIDDAHMFHGRDGYPTIEQLAAFAKQEFPGYHFAVTHNIIELLPDLSDLVHSQA